MSILQGLGFSRYVNDKSRPLGEIYKRAYSDLIREMNDYAATPWRRDRARAMLVRVNEVVKKLDAETRAFIEKEVPSMYFATATELKKDIRKLDLTVPAQFGQIHTTAIEAAAEDAMLKFGRTMVGIQRSAEELVRFGSQQATREIIAAGQIRGAAAKEIAKEVQARIESDGITALIDRGGKRWQLDVYAEMVARQVMANAGREGVINTAQEFGLDIVEITTHGSAHDECAVWEGVQVSLTGKTPGYKSLDEAKESGLLHVHCKHGFFVVTKVSRPRPYEPADEPYETVRVGDVDLDLRGGNFHRIVDQKEYAYMLNSAQLAPTPKGLFGTDDDGKKFFGVDANVGRFVTMAAPTPGPKYEIVVNAKDMPPMRNDPKMQGSSVYVTEPIPVSKIRARKL